MHITWSLFPKLYPHLSPLGLAELVREAGLDTTNLVVRDGYWVRPETMKTDLPPFIKAMRDAGLTIRFATTGFSAAAVAANPDLISILGDSGLTEFRLDHFRLDYNRGKGSDVRGSLAQARRQMEAIVPVCERAGVRAVYQVHHETLIASASAAWTLVDGLPAQCVGVELDPGNQSFEGFEAWGRSVALLGDSLVAVAIKDTALRQEPGRADTPNKGWRRDWCPIDEGVTDWYAFVRALSGNNFCGTFVFMPFYDAENPAAVTPKLKREVAYLRRVVAEAVQKKAEEIA